MHFLFWYLTYTPYHVLSEDEKHLPILGADHLTPTFRQAEDGHRDELTSDPEKQGRFSSLNGIRRGEGCKRQPIYLHGGPMCKPIGNSRDGAKTKSTA